MHAHGLTWSILFGKRHGQEAFLSHVQSFRAVANSDGCDRVTGILRREAAPVDEGRAAPVVYI